MFFGFESLVRFLFGRRLSRFFLVKVFSQFLFWVFKILKIKGEIDGHRILLCSKVALGYFAKVIQKPFEIKVFKENIKEGDVVLDIGANIGYYTLLAAKIVGKEGKVFAFEPEEKNFFQLKENVRINNYQNVILIKKAVSEKNGKLKFYLHEGDATMHSFFSENKSTKWIEVETVSLDNFFKGKKIKIDFIKMDIEGAEFLALQGMKRILKESPKMKMMVEFNPSMLKKAKAEPEEFLNSLSQTGFKIYQINEKERKLILIKPEEFENFTQNYQQDYTNLLCLK
jgi:FkbM family methyltransferase